MAGYPTLSLGTTGPTAYSGALTANATSNTFYLGGGGGALTVNTVLTDRPRRRTA